jgi:hypothetical protein
VVLLALIKEDVVEPDAVEVEVREVFEMLDVALVEVGQQWLSCQDLMLLVNNMNNTIPTQ